MPAVNIKNLSVAQLLTLRNDIDAQLKTKRSELERQLREIGGPAVPGRRGAKKGVRIAPKFRDASGNTWAGRGAQPKWLTAALKAGKKLDDFRIAKPGRKKRAARK